MMNEKLADRLQQLQIDRSETAQNKNGLFGRKTFIALFIALLIGVGFSIYYYQGSLFPNRANAGTEANAKPSAAPAAEAARYASSDGEIPVLSAAGYVVAKNKVEVGSKILGRIQQIEVDAGDFVRQGQIIARLESRDLEAQLKQSEADLQVAQKRYDELIAGSRSQEISQANAKLELAEANLRIASLNLDRYKKLLQQGVIAAQQVDSAQNDFEVRQAEEKAARQAFELVREGPRAESTAVLKGEIELAQTKVELYKTQLKDAVIQSPINGVVLERMVQVGEVVAPGVGGGPGFRTGIIRVASFEELRVEIDINEGDISKLQVNQPADATLESIPDKTFKGYISRIYPEANRQKGTIKVEVALFKSTPLFKPELSAKVVFKQMPGAKANAN